MALIVPLTLPATSTMQNGVLVEIPETLYPEAYARVLFSRAHSDKSYICVGWYPTEAARFAGEPHVWVAEFVTDTPTLTGDYFPALYTYLKTLPQFEGAIDHLVVDPAEVVVPVDPVVDPTNDPQPTQPEGQA